MHHDGTAFQQARGKINTMSLKKDQESTPASCTKTDNYSHTFNLEAPINLTALSVYVFECGNKLEYPEITHKDTGRTCNSACNTPTRLQIQTKNLFAVRLEF